MDALAAATGNARDLVRMQLDDQVDAKSLLGAYVCTAVPGEFAWQPGLLTQVQHEHRPDAALAPTAGKSFCNDMTTFSALTCTGQRGQLPMHPVGHAALRMLSGRRTR